jgi:hypothetical protein
MGSQASPAEVGVAVQDALSRPRGDVLHKEAEWRV